MSQPNLANEIAATVIATASYRDMGTIPDVGGAVGFEAAAVNTSDALQNLAVPALPDDVAYEIQNMRANAFPILGDVAAAMADPRARNTVRLAEAGVRVRLVEQARNVIRERNRNAGMTWTRYLGAGVGGRVRNTVNLVHEAGPMALLWGDGDVTNRRIAEEVTQQIQTRFAGRTFDTLDPADQLLVRQEMGQLAPNTLAFNAGPLLEWARTNNSPVINTMAVPPAPFTYYQLCEALLGREGVASRYAIPILALMQKNPAYATRLEEIYRNRAGIQPVQAAYETQRTARAADETSKKNLTERIQRIEAALKLLSQIQEQETIRSRNQAEATTLNGRLNPTPPTTPPTPTGLTPQVEKEERANLRAYNDKAIQAAGSLMRLVGDLKSQYRRDLIPFLIPPVTFANLLEINPNTGALITPATPDNLISSFQTTLDGDATTTPAIVGLREQLNTVQTRIDSRDESYSTTNNSDLFTAGYKDFNDLKAKNETASQSRSENTRLTPHQLLYEMQYRQLVVEIPPTGAPAVAGARNLPLEQAQTRAVIGTLMLIDRVDSTMDEGFAVRQANATVRGRFRRFLERNSRVSFDEFVKNTLLREDRFKGLKELKLTTTANDILGWINADELKEADLPEFMRQIELLGQDQLREEGKLAFGVDVRPLFYQIQLAYYRRKADAMIVKANEPGVSNKAEILLNLLKEEAPKAIPPVPEPGSRPLGVETRSKASLRQLKETIQAEIASLGETSPEGQLLKTRLDYLDKYSSRFVADALFTVMARLPDWWRRRKIATAATEALEEIPGTIKRSRRAISEALEEAELAPAGAHA